MGQRLFTVDVFASFHGGRSHNGVRVVGRRDDDAIQLGVKLVQHHAEVAVMLRRWILLESCRSSCQVDIAEGDHILLAQALQVRCAATPNPHEPQVQFLAGRCLPAAGYRVSWDDRKTSRRCRHFEKFSAFHARVSESGGEEWGMGNKEWGMSSWSGGHSPFTINNQHTAP